MYSCFQDGDNGISIRYRFDGKLFTLRRLQASQAKNALDDVFAMYKSEFSEYFDLIYPCELEIKETSDTITPVSYLD